MPTAKDKRPFNLKIFWHTRNYLVFTILLALGAGIIVLAGIIPQLQAANELRLEGNQMAPKLEKLEQKLAQLENVRYTPEFSQVDIINRALPSKKPLLELLTNLNMVAVSEQIQITELQLSPGLVATDSAELNAENARRRASQNSQGVDVMDLTLSVRGPRENLHRFLSGIEKISPFSTIVKLSVSSERAGETEAQAELTLNTFFFTQTIKTTVDAPLPVLADQDLFVLNELSSFELNELPIPEGITDGGLEDLFGADPILFLN